MYRLEGRSLGPTTTISTRPTESSWTWSDWNFDNGVGCPTFLNFGRNYADARDEFVYVYSQDHDSAYKPAHRMVLARVAKTRVREQEAFFRTSRGVKIDVRVADTLTHNSEQFECQPSPSLHAKRIDEHSRGAIFCRLAR